MMKIINNEDLSKYTTIRIGGIAKIMYIPESRDELLEVVRTIPSSHVIGGGSNLLINNREFESVISLREFDQNIEDQGRGVFIVGASVRLQKLINTINEKGYGGIEYLYSVPGLVGGAVVMNAGRGRQHQKSISDYLKSVTLIHEGKEVTWEKKDCGFGYRNSIFKNSGDIILSAQFLFPEMSQEEASKEKQARLDLCKKFQDSSHPNFGSVFLESSGAIMSVVQKLKLGGKKAHFSAKTKNWIINEDHAEFTDVYKAIQKAEKMHRLIGKKCIREVIIWE